VLANAVPGFQPSRHGLHFANRWPSGPTVRLGALDARRVGVGDASAGLCGGMAFTVRDLWEHGLEPPPDTEPPPNGSPRFIAIVRRQVHSLDWLRLPLRFWINAMRPDLPERVRDVEWPRIRAEIDAGRLAQVGLVRATGINPKALTQNHQVLAYGYEATDAVVVLRIYDPNWPDRDDVLLQMSLAGPRPAFWQSTGEPSCGFFLAPYRPAVPRAWRGPR
jgi:hypothetical protein